MHARQRTAKQKKKEKHEHERAATRNPLPPSSHRAISRATQSRPIMAASLAYAIGRTFG